VRNNGRVVTPPSAGPEIAGVRITNPGRVVYQDVGLTKLDVARYYEKIADLILPHLEDRPLSTVRCPQGAGGACFFNKHLDVEGVPGLRNIPIKESKGTLPYAIVEDIRGLIYLAQMNVLELHVWGSKASDLERPDRLVFDFDPGEGTTWKDVVYGTKRAREILDKAGLESFLKTTGGKGLHVVVPLKPGAKWDQVKEWCHTLASTMAAQEPDRFVDNMSKAKRRGKIFVDYLRNQRGATSIAAFSTRARPGANVSMPISWNDLNRVTNADFSIESEMKARPRKDPWAGPGFWKARQSLKAATG
jgi:bifunctional non-homologous end joining protein LigD